MPFWAMWFDRADVWIETPDVQMAKGLFYVSLLVGFVMTWVWQKLR